MTRLLILTHVAATLFLVGLIWTIQVVHYPLFAKVGSESYTAYQAGHQWRITVVVLPVMLVELVTAGLLLWLRPAVIPVWMVWTGVLLVGAIWLSTAMVQAPLHGLLDRGFDQTAWARLVATNWFRTIAWTVRGGLAVWMVALLLK